MSFRVEHELHTRRHGRNVGVALVLVAFIAIVFGLTMVKVQSGAFEAPRGEVASQ
jgi:ABC-type transporter Mla subunit MlaD